MVIMQDYVTLTVTATITAIIAVALYGMSLSYAHRLGTKKAYSNMLRQMFDMEDIQLDHIIKMG